MYGADGKTPELRPASIKGVMRFWWRAINGDLPLDDLKKQEDEIFGSTEKRSKVIIRVSIEDFVVKKVLELKNKQKFQYLFFSLYMQTKNDKDKKYFDSLKFKVILSSYDKNALKEASYSFILLSLFGGLGNRSRRGGGSFRIDSIDDKSYEKLLCIGENCKEVEQSLKNIYKIIKDYFREKYNYKNTTNIYHNLSHLNFKISSISYKSIEDSLTKIEELYKYFRKNNSILSNASFGLPIMRPKIYTKPKVDRLASPIIIKILKIENNYYWLVLKLDGNNLKNDTKVNFITKNKEKIEKNLDNNILEKFLNKGLNNV
jgi:CRISPR-associated protein Cmr1